MMKNVILSLCALFSIQLAVSAQQLEPVKWSFEAEKTSESEYTLHFTADIDKDWVIYGMEELEDGPIPTSINFDEGSYELLSEISTTSESTITDDPLFMVKLEKFKTQADFTQVVSVDGATTISGWVTFMTCDGERCLPPKDIDFSFDLK